MLLGQRMITRKNENAGGKLCCLRWSVRAERTNTAGISTQLFQVTDFDIEVKLSDDSSNSKQIVKSSI